MCLSNLHELVGPVLVLFGFHCGICLLQSLASLRTYWGYCHKVHALDTFKSGQQGTTFRVCVKTLKNSLYQEAVRMLFRQKESVSLSHFHMWDWLLVRTTHFFGLQARCDKTTGWYSIQVLCTPIHCDEGEPRISQCEDGDFCSLTDMSWSTLKLHFSHVRPRSSFKKINSGWTFLGQGEKTLNCFLRSHVALLPPARNHGSPIFTIWILCQGYLYLLKGVFGHFRVRKKSMLIFAQRMICINQSLCALAHPTTLLQLQRHVGQIDGTLQFFHPKQNQFFNWKGVCVFILTKQKPHCSTLCYVCWSLFLRCQMYSETPFSTPTSARMQLFGEQRQDFHLVDGHGLLLPTVGILHKAWSTNDWQMSSGRQDNSVSGDFSMWFPSYWLTRSVESVLPNCDPRYSGWGNAASAKSLWRPEIKSWLNTRAAPSAFSKTLWASMIRCLLVVCE